jgi:CheY-like chemotaxis protein
MAHASAAWSEAPVEGREPRLLVADNDPFFQQLLRDVLEEEGYAVEVARDGLEALDLIHSEPPDCLVLDLIMPKIDGARLCWYLKEDPELARLPVLVVSGIVAEATPHRLPLPADAVVAKGPAPEFAANVKAAVRRLLAHPRSPTPGAVFGLERINPREIVQELLTLKRHHEALLDALGEAILEADADGRVVYANALALRLLDRAERALIGRRLAEVFGAEPAAELRDSFAHVMASAGPGLARIEFAWGDRQLEATLARLPDGTAEAGATLIVRDATPLARARRALEATFDAIDDAVVLVDPRRRILRANPAAARQAGHDDGMRLAGECCCRLFCGKADPPDGACPVEEAVRTGEVTAIDRIDPRAGLAVRCWAYPIRDGRGAVEAVVEVQRRVAEGGGPNGPAGRRAERCLG